jgi:hypothetical protein
MALDPLSAIAGLLSIPEFAVPSPSTTLPLTEINAKVARRAQHVLK